MTPNFVVVVSVLLPFCCHIDWGMPYLCIFLKKLLLYQVQLLINRCEHLSVVRIRLVKVAAKNINAKLFACELWEKGLVHLVCYCIVANDP